MTCCDKTYERKRPCCDGRVDRYVTRSVMIADLAAHLVITAALSVFFYWNTGKISAAFLCVLGGVLIDADHVVDYFLHYGKMFHARKFLYGTYLDSGKSYVFVHSWELVIVLWGASFFFGSLTPLAASITAHMAVDQTQANKTPFFYFLFYRWYHGFAWENTAPMIGENAKKRG